MQTDTNDLAPGMNAEQHWSMARVAKWLPRCDTLEAQLHQTRTLGAHLLAA